VHIRLLRIDPATGIWGLSEPTTCEALVGSDASPIVHLAWGGTSIISDLAVIDAAGRIAVVEFSSLLNYGSLVRRWDSEQGDDTHSIVGCLWLPVQNVTSRPFTCVYGPAVRVPADNSNNSNSSTSTGNHFYQHSSSALPAGLTFPSTGRSGLVTVTSHGLVQLMWNSGRTLQPEKVSAEIGGTFQPGDYITHAAITIDKRMFFFSWSDLQRVMSQSFIV